MNLTDSFAQEKPQVHDGLRKLFRTANELVRRLDGIRKHANTCDDLFTVDARVLRIRLREQCERLMFYDPVGHGKKAEDSLWKIVYYDVISTGKQLRGEDDETADLALYEHLNAATGTYHHLLFRIETEFELKNASADFVYPFASERTRPSLSSAKIASTDDDKIEEKDAKKSSVCIRTEWAMYAFHRCLVCLGDLARYRYEMYGICGPEIASRYYAQAAIFLPSLGMPHNQQGTLAGTQNYGCDSAYHYMRCLVSEQSFEGSKGNLEHIFDKADRLVANASVQNDDDDAANAIDSPNVKSCLGKFLQFCQFCCVDDNVNSSVQLKRICQDIIQEFQTCLSVATKEETSANATISDDLVFRLVAIAIMGTYQITKKLTTNHKGVMAFSLALFSNLLQYTVSRLRGTNVEAEDSETKATRASRRPVRVRLRRLRQQKDDLEEDSDLSEEDERSTNEEWNQMENSDASETDEHENSSDSDRETDADTDLEGSPKGEEGTKISNGQRNKTNGEAKWKCRNGKGRFSRSRNLSRDLVAHEWLLMALKLYADWLNSEPDIVMVVARCCPTLWSRLTSLLNLVSPALMWDAKDGVCNSELLIGLQICRLGHRWCQPWPLPEDVLLRGFPLFNDAHSTLDFNSLSNLWLNPVEMSALRIACIHQFGLNLVNSEATDLTYDQQTGQFHQMTTATEQQPSKDTLEVQKKKMMENMAHLWLKAEVSELETSMKSKNQPRLSPYVVVTAAVLTDHLPTLRHLVASKRFIIIIPCVGALKRTI